MYRQPFAPLLPGFRRVPYGDAAALAEAVDGTVAAVILEPIQGEAGVVVPPQGYLRAAREVCDRHGALLILDEVQTGIGRCGRLFACEEAGVVPDILCMAKSLGGGVVPIGAFTARPAVWEPFDSNPYLHSSTFGGNPLAMAAGIAALETIREEGLLERARERGDQLLRGLRAIAAEHPDVVADVRGRGLLIGLEMVSEGAGGMLLAELVDARVLVVHSFNNYRVVRFMPPAVIAPAQCDQVLEAVDRAVRATAANVGEL
jgi:putrescine aminotransferase